MSAKSEGCTLGDGAAFFSTICLTVWFFLFLLPLAGDLLDVVTAGEDIVWVSTMDCQRKHKDFIIIFALYLLIIVSK